MVAAAGPALREKPRTKRPPGLPLFEVVYVIFFCSVHIRKVSSLPARIKNKHCSEDLIGKKPFL